MLLSFDVPVAAYVANVDTKGYHERLTYLDLVYEVGLIQQINAHGHYPRGSTQAVHIAAVTLLLSSYLLPLWSLSELRMRRVVSRNRQHFRMSCKWRLR